jgi:CBS domain containing-hemolysin-like protein
MFQIPQEDIVSISIFLACLVGSALFSAAETAVTSLGVLKTKHLIDSRENDAGVLKFWLRYPGRVLTTVLIFNTLVNALASAVITQMASRHIDNAVGIATGIVTFLVLIFGEVIPKSFARANSEPLAPLAIRIVRLFYFIFYPAVVALSEFANWIIRLLGSKEKFTPTLTEEELEFIINEGTSSGVMEDLKKDMLSGVFEFDETKVSEIMTPRLDVVAIQKNATVQEALRAVTESGHSRLPVYDDRIDNVIGVLFAKDLLRHVTTKGNVEIKLTTLMREPFFTPESKPIMDVFKDLKRTKNHLSIVIDEYGGMAGIVTMEDILEEIVGDIQDEFDAEEAAIVKVGEGVFDVAGTFNIEEFIEYFKLKEFLTEDELKDVDTVAGWMIQKLGEMPKVGQSLAVGPLSFEVTEVVRHRIAKVRVVQSIEPEDRAVGAEA